MLPRIRRGCLAWTGHTSHNHCSGNRPGKGHVSVPAWWRFITKVFVECLFWMWHHPGLLKEGDSFPVLQMKSECLESLNDHQGQSLCLTGKHWGQSEEGEVSLTPSRDKSGIPGWMAVKMEGKRNKPIGGKPMNLRELKIREGSGHWNPDTGLLSPCFLHCLCFPAPVLPLSLCYFNSFWTEIHRGLRVKCIWIWSWLYYLFAV